MITEKPCNRAASNLVSTANGDPMLDPKAMKSKFLNGDGDCLYYYDKNEINPSNYQRQHKGLQIYNNHARIVDDYRTTLAGTTVPDPAVLRATGMRFHGFSKDLANMTARGLSSAHQANRMNNTFGDTFTIKNKERFGGEENDGTHSGPLMQKRFKRTTGHFFS